MLPNFLGMGAGRAGTTWLYLCLKEHPEIYVPRIKELDFFSWHYEKGWEWYESFFAKHRDEKAIGEISPSYMITAEVPERICEWKPDVNLMFVLRNPIYRAYSHYCMELRAARASEDVDSVIVPGTRFVDEGLYYNHISRFLKFFRPKQIKVLLYDDLQKAPNCFLEEVYTFLGVAPRFRPSMLCKSYHVQKPRPRFQKPLNTLVRTAQWFSGRSELADRTIEYLRKRGYPDLFHRLNRGPAYPILSAAKKRSLAEYYREDVEALSQLLSRDLTHWVRKYLD